MEEDRKCFISMCEVVEQTIKMKIYSKCSSAHVKINFDNLAEKVTPRS